MWVFVSLLMCFILLIYLYLSECSSAPSVLSGDFLSDPVLQTFRDHRCVDAPGYLAAMWPACKAVMAVARSWDTDGDGMIENSGFPDQTYDTWVMRGVSAYCGGLWLAALYAMVQMAGQMGDQATAAEYADLLARAQQVYVDKLWTGEPSTWGLC